MQGHMNVKKNVQFPVVSSDSKTAEGGLDF